MSRESPNWTEILKPPYSTYQCEEDAYIEISKITIDNEIAMEFLYENAVQDNTEVCRNLRLMYHEAVNGTNKDVRRRMQNRMSHFKRLYGKIHETLREQSMLHAMDYANMDVVQLRRRMKEAKMKDKRMTTFVREQTAKLRLKKAMKASATLSVAPREVSNDTDKTSQKDDGDDEEVQLIDIDNEEKEKREDHKSLGQIDASNYDGDAEDYFSDKENEENFVRKKRVMYFDASSMSGPSTSKKEPLFHNVNEEDENIVEAKEVDTVGNFKQYGSKKKFATKRKRLVVEQRDEGPSTSRNLPSIPKSKAEKEFERVMKMTRNKNIEVVHSSEDEMNKIQDVINAYEPSAKKKKKDNLETRVLEQVLKSAKAFENASIDQRAFLRSRANDSNVDLKKYVDEVKAEMAAEEGSDDDSAEDVATSISANSCDGEDSTVMPNTQIPSRLQCPSPVGNASSSEDQNGGLSPHVSDAEYENQMANPQMQSKFPEYY